MGAQPDTSTSAPEVWHGVLQILAPIFVPRLLATYLGIIDTQTVKCIPVRGPRGYDVAKLTVGRKRVVLVDADGVWLAVATVPASVQERDTLPALDDGSAHWPSLRLAIF